MGKKTQEKDEGVATDKILEYLNKQNRPYNAGDIFSNLHEAIGKTMVTRCLASLAADGKVNEKVYGKQKIYYPLQSQFPKMDPAEIDEADKHIEELKSELSGLKEECSELQKKINELSATPTTEEAKKELDELHAENQKLQARLSKIQESSDLVSEEKRTKVFKAYTDGVKAWSRRKRTADDMLGAILEGWPKSKKALLEEVGIETDEECKVSLKDFKK